MGGVLLCAIHLRTISREILNTSIFCMILKITDLRFWPHLLAANELIDIWNVNTDLRFFELINLERNRVTDIFIF